MAGIRPLEAEYRPYSTWGIRRLDGPWNVVEYPPNELADQYRVLVCNDMLDAIAGATAQFDGGDIVQPGAVEVVRYEHRAEKGYLWVAYDAVEVAKMAKQHGERLVAMAGEFITVAGTLTTIECSRPGDAYTMFENARNLDVHLAPPTQTGGTGKILCGFERMGVGFSVGGGITGPGVTHHPCPACRNLIGQRPITGLHKALFTEEEVDGRR